ncbi:hypothetical protein D3C78_1207360 [compost metagenome]
MQPFERVVGGAASDSGKVVDLPAHAPHAAGLLDDAGLLHPPKELHPLHRQDAGIRSLAEHGEHMLFQSADGANRRPFRPGLALHRVPLAGQVLERVVGGFDLGGADGALGRQCAPVLRRAVAQLRSLLASQCPAHLGITAHAQP